MPPQDYTARQGAAVITMPICCRCGDVVVTASAASLHRCVGAGAGWPQRLSVLGAPSPLRRTATIRHVTSIDDYHFTTPVEERRRRSLLAICRRRRSDEKRESYAAVSSKVMTVNVLHGLPPEYQQPRPPYEENMSASAAIRTATPYANEEFYTEHIIGLLNILVATSATPPPVRPFLY